MPIETTVPTSTDVLVVGAGPGGAAAAYHLARHGVDVTVVDKATFPRDKTCGDGLTPRAVAAMDRMGVVPDDRNFAPANGLRTYGTGGTTLFLPWPKLRSWPSVGYVSRRFDFDRLLLERAEAAGAKVIQGVEAVRPLTEGGWITGARLKPADGDASDAVDTRARYVLAADGHASRFAGAVGVKRVSTKAIGIAARRYYRTDRPFEPVLESFLNLRKGDGIMPGYGWIFFLPDGTLNVGAGLLNTFKGFRDVSAQRVFDIFVQGLPPEWEVTEANALGPVRSGPLPTSLNRAPLAMPGMLLIGDAAGTINPFNGEGISSAMESAEMASELLVEALAKDRPGIAAMYPTLMRQRYARYYAMGNLWTKWIGNPTFMRLAVKYAVPRTTLMAFALRVLANLTDGEEGDFQDKLMHLMVSIAPEGA